MDFEPQELLPAMPPMVQRAQVEGSTGIELAVGLQRVVQRAEAMPGSTRAVSPSTEQHARRCLRAVQHERAVTVLAALAGAGAARQDRDPSSGRSPWRPDVAAVRGTSTPMGSPW
jgi:hypothetical protein